MRTRSVRAVALLAAALLAGPALPSGMAVQQPPATRGSYDAAQGRAMHEKDCVACHTRRFGDAGSIYTRQDRKVTSPARLKAQVALCNSELAIGYFPEDEEHVAAYLNLQFYKFAD